MRIKTSSFVANVVILMRPFGLEFRNEIFPPFRELRKNSARDKQSGIQMYNYLHKLSHLHCTNDYNPANLTDVVDSTFPALEELMHAPDDRQKSQPIKIVHTTSLYLAPDEMYRIAPVSGIRRRQG